MMYTSQQKSVIVLIRKSAHQSDVVDTMITNRKRGDVTVEMTCEDDSLRPVGEWFPPTRAEHTRGVASGGQDGRRKSWCEVILGGSNERRLPEVATIVSGSRRR